MVYISFYGWGLYFILGISDSIWSLVYGMFGYTLNYFLISLKWTIPFNVFYFIYIRSSLSSGWYNHITTTILTTPFSFKWWSVTVNRLWKRRKPDGKEKNARRSNYVNAIAMFLILSPKLTMTQVNHFKICLNAKTNYLKKSNLFNSTGLNHYKSGQLI